MVAFREKVFTPSHPAPALVDLTVAQAKVAASKDHFSLRTRKGQTSITVAAGSVISQIPKAGTSLKQGSTMSVVPSLGPPPVPVPSLTGMTCAQATSTLQAAHLKSVCAPAQYSNTIPAGVLISWSFGSTATPTSAPYGSTIALVPSNGHAPVTVPTIPSTDTFAQAQAALQAVGLAATQAPQASTSVSAGQVIATAPAAGAVAPYGSTVTVTVSSGPPMVAVPNVIGDTVSQATTALQAAGLTVSGVQGNPNAMATGTNPPTGTTVVVGSSVSILT